MASEAAAAIGSPWITIWIRPRATIRRIVDTDPHYRVVFLAMLTGALSGLESRWSGPPAAGAPGAALWPLLVVASVVTGGIFGVVGLYLNGVLLKWAGALLGGSATYAEVRAALAWAEVPAITAMALGIVAILLGAGAPLAALGQPSLTGLPSGSTVMHAALALWSFVITLKCLGEVQRFPARRAFVSLAIVLLVFLALGMSILAAVSGVPRFLHPAATV